MFRGQLACLFTDLVDVSGKGMDLAIVPVDHFHLDDDQLANGGDFAVMLRYAGLELCRHLPELYFGLRHTKPYRVSGGLASVMPSSVSTFGFASSMPSTL